MTKQKVLMTDLHCHQRLLEDVTITLPDLARPGAWYLCVNTFGDGEGRYFYKEDQAPRIEHEFCMRPRSVAIFTGRNY